MEGGDEGGLGLRDWRGLRGRAKRMFMSGARSFAERDLLSYASAIAFQVLFALVPLTLAAIALLGFFNLEEIWEEELGPEVQDLVQPDAFSVIDRTVEQILGEKRGLWLTFGAVFALWQISGAVRATMSPLNLMYSSDEERPWWKRFLVSIALALAIGPLVVSAALIVQAGPRLLGLVELPTAVAVALRIGRWGVAVVLLAAAVLLLIHYAPAKPQSLGWASLGTVFVVVSWLVASLGFGLYAAYVADYGSVFGGLATVIVLMTYIYISCLALLFGIQLDVCVREEVRETRARG